MKNIKLFLILAALALIFSSCGNMLTDTGEDITIDLSSVVSKDWGDAMAKIWLVQELSTGPANNFYDLPVAEAYQDVEDNKAVLSSIPVGTYTLYITIGEEVVNDDSDTVFVPQKYITSDPFSIVAGSVTPLTIEAADLKTTVYEDLAGRSLMGSAAVNGTVFTAASDGERLYYGEAGDYDSVFAALEPETAGDTFNDVDEGINQTAFITMKAADGHAIATIDASEASISGLDYDISADLPTQLPDASPIDLESSFVFFIEGETDAEDMQAAISQFDGGIVITTYFDFDGDGTPTYDIFAIDLSDAFEALAEYDIEFGWDFFNGFAVMEKPGDEIWVYLATDIGNFKLEAGLGAEGLESGITEEGADILDFLTEFALSNDNLKDRAILNIANNDNRYLYVATDKGLYKIDTDDDTAADKLYAEDSRIELLSCGDDYTACVTPLSLILLNSAGETAEIGFNEGLPSGGLLSEGGITGLNWDGNVLYIAGDNGLASVDADELTYTAE